MPTALQSRDDLLADLSPALAAAGAIVALVLWLLSWRACRRRPEASWIWIFCGFVLASGGIWLVFQGVAQRVVFATSWPLHGLALAGGAAAQFLALCYRFERGLVKPGRGAALLGLRLTALAALLVILAQPVLSFVESREVNREIAVLIDDSDSMLLAEESLTVTERLDRAALLGLAEIQGRPPLHEVARAVRALDRRFESELDAIAAAPNPETGLVSRARLRPVFLAEALGETEALSRLIETSLEATAQSEVRRRLQEWLTLASEVLPDRLSRAEEAAEQGDAPGWVAHLREAREDTGTVIAALVAAIEATDADFYETGLDEAGRGAVDGTAALSRLELAERILETPLFPGSGSGAGDGEAATRSLIERLREDYNVRLYRFAREIVPVTDPDAELGAESELEMEIGLRPAASRTDLAGALDHVLANTARESLAGVLLLSDGRHNGENLPEDALRQLAVQGSPLSAVPLGGAVGPVDISLLSLAAPESIYLDDRVVVAAEVKIDGLLGETVAVELVGEGEVLDRVEIEVDDVNFRTEVRLAHRPEAKGILDYQVRLPPDERERFHDNNEWEFKVAVTDDRTNVLLVDGFPRWEFRYLRNLFYGRDKSVHLQYVLTNPDEIFRSSRPERVVASASRPFGEAEATELPEDPLEWGRFDVVILGDIAPVALSPRQWEAIEESVTRRGALLVIVSGARHMPHAHEGSALRRLLPVVAESTRTWQGAVSEPAYLVELTNTGIAHPVTMQSPSRSLNREIWAGFQPMRWRHVPLSVKESAEVLAYARPVGTPGLAEAALAAPDGSPGSVEAALERLAKQQDLERENALVVSMRAGLGKVLLLNFDETWRLRYGAGDTYHHRFWGQVVRWGAGENLRSGNEFVRLGSDRLSYLPGDPVEVTAKILDEERRPVVETRVEVEVWREGERLSSQRLGYRSDSSGLYETSLYGLQEEGEYELRLVGEAVDRALELEPEGPEEIATELLVLGSRNPVELAELTADRDFLARATSITGGRLCELPDLTLLPGTFAAPKETLTERRKVTLWDTWPMLLTFLGVLTTEWILRRRSGLV